MLDRLLRRVRDTAHGEPLLRGYLWWGLLIRGALLAALATLLLVEGNVLAEWLLTTRLPFVSPADVEEFSALSYGVLVLVCSVGMGARWALLGRLETTGRSPTSTSATPTGGSSSPADREEK